MTKKENLTRRGFIKTSAGGLAALSIPSWLTACGASPKEVAMAENSAPRPQLPLTYFEEGFGVSEEIIRAVLERGRARGGDWVDLYFQHRLTRFIGLEDQVVNKASTSVDLGCGVRVVNQDQQGYAYTESLTKNALCKAADTAAAIAQNNTAIPPVELLGRSTQTNYDRHYDWSLVGIEELIPILTTMDERARAADASVKRVSMSLATQQDRIMIVDGLGQVFFDSQPMTTLRLNLVMEKDGERQSNGYNISARQGLEFYSEERLQRVLDKALARTRVLFEAQKPPAGEMPVVLAAGSSGILLHEAIGHGMEADFNRKGTSIFADRIGEKVAEEHVTIVDSGLDQGARGAINIDDEGNQPQATTLVEKGILRSYMHDQISARHYGVDPTGSGRRQSFRYPPLPRMRSTYMLNGPHSRDEIIASVKHGIYAESFTNGQVQIGAGDYSFYVKNGMLIEDGKLTAPIKDVNIIGNGPDSLSKISMVADDFALDESGWTCGKGGQGVPVSLGLPHSFGLKSDRRRADMSQEDLYTRAQWAMDEALKAGADQVAVRVGSQRKIQLSQRDGELEKLQEANSLSLSVSLYSKGRYARHSTSDMRPDALKAFIGDALTLTEMLGEDPHRSLADPALYEGRPELDLQLNDPSFHQRTAQQRRDEVAKLEAAALAVDGPIISVNAEVNDSHNLSIRLHSNGFEGKRESTSSSIVAWVTVEDGERKPADGLWAAERYHSDLPDIEAIGRGASERALRRIGQQKLTSGKRNLIIENRAASKLLSYLMRGFYGSALQQERTFLAGKEGELIASPLLTISDNPHLTRGLGSGLYDSDGITARPRKLVSAGKLDAFLIDVYYANKLGVAPTGGDTFNLEIPGGHGKLEELLQDVQDGILVTSFLGGNSDTTRGDFSLGIFGFLVEKGELSTPIGEMNIAGNHESFWQQLTAIGDDPYTSSSWRTPTLVFEGIDVSGA